MIDCSSCIFSKDEICPANKGKCDYKSFYEVDSHNREEAINHLITVRNTCFANGYDSAVEDACDVAIKALTAIENIKSDLKVIRFTDKNAQAGFNIAVAIFNKHLKGESE